jgi:YD repeat-containing protein
VEFQRNRFGGIPSPPRARSDFRRCLTGAAVQYDYSLGKPTSTKDINGNTTSYTYADAFCRLTLVTRKDTGTSRGRLYTESNPFYSSSSTCGTDLTTYSYDGLNRQLTATAPDASDQAFLCRRQHLKQEPDAGDRPNAAQPAELCRRRRAADGSG